MANGSKKVVVFQPAGINSKLKMRGFSLIYKVCLKSNIKNQQ